MQPMEHGGEGQFAQLVPNLPSKCRLQPVFGTVDNIAKCLI
jgi:hypothetical protein